MKKIYSIIFLLMFVTSVVNAADRYAVASGDWSSTSTWSATSGGASGASVPVLGDNVFIEGGFDVTVTADAECDAITISATGSILTVDATFTLDVTTSITLVNTAATNTDATLTGAGTINCASVVVGGTITVLTADATTTFTSTVSILAVSGDISVNGEDDASDDNNATFNLQSGSVTVGGTVVLDEEGASIVNFTMASGAGSGTLTLSGATPITIAGGALFDPNGATAIVNYSGAAQTILPDTYKNLTLSGSGIKSLDADATVTNDLTINSGVTFQPTADFDLSLGGDLINEGSLNSDNGTFEMDVIFNGAANQTVSGAGILTEFNAITVINTGAVNDNTVEIASTNCTVIVGGFLTLTSGIFKVSGTFSLTNTFFNAGAYTINTDEGFWLNNPNVTVTGQGNTATLNGMLRITAGTYNAGTSNNSMTWGNGAVFTMEGGAFNVAARLAPSAATSTNSITFTMSGGTLTTSMGSSATPNASGSISSFDIPATGTSSSFTMSGGTIVMQKVSSGVDYRMSAAGTVSITGGTVQFGNASTTGSPAFDIGAASGATNVLPSLSVNATGTPTVTLNTAATVRGNVTIATGTSLLGNGQAISVTGNSVSTPGNWTNNGTFTSGTQTTTFNGSNLQTISGATSFSGLTINNSGAGVTLTSDVTVNAVLTLTDGIVTTAASPSGLLILSSTGTNPGFGSTGSHINGPIRKTGSGAFTFPVGNGGTLYRPIDISSLSGSLTFTASYTQANPKTTFTNTMGTGLTHISACEYWILDRTEVSGTATVRLNFGIPSCNSNPYVDDPPSLRVARFTGASGSPANTWENAGNTSSSSTHVTSSPVSTFSPFTVGSDGVNNPLPVNLSNIRAFEKQQGIQIDWTAYQEHNLSHYAVERSADGVIFTSIGQVASLNSAVEKNYGFFDASPFAGVNFYRLRTNDIDGKYGYSAIVKVNLDRSVKDISLYPNPVTGGFISFQGANLAKGNYTVKVYNSAGMQIMGQSFNHTGGAINQTLKLPNGIKSGMYSLQLVSDGVKLMSKTFIVQ